MCFNGTSYGTSTGSKSNGSKSDSPQPTPFKAKSSDSKTASSMRPKARTDVRRSEKSLFSRAVSNVKQSLFPRG